MAPSKMTAFGIVAAALLLISTVEGSFINIHNQCPYPVTACAQSANDRISQYQIGAGQSQKLDFGPGNYWPQGAIWPSVGGQCAAPGNPAAARDRNLANLAELNLAGGTADHDTYDLSNVDAYTLPVMINPTYIPPGKFHRTSGIECGTVSCSIPDIRSFCSGPNRLVQNPTGSLTCLNTDGPGLAVTAGTEAFRRACPTSYSYSKADPTSTYHCTPGTNYDVVFCP